MSLIIQPALSSKNNKCLYKLKVINNVLLKYKISRGRSRTAVTSKMECFVIIVNGWKPLTIITKRSILDVAAALDPPLINPPIFGGKHFANP